MKKLTAWMLAALMVLSMAGCGKQAESTEVSSAEKSETAATTAAVTTEAETPARTVEPTTEAVKDLSAEEAWKALLGHIADFAEAMADKEKGDAVSLSLSGKLALGVTLSMDNDGEPFEMPIALEGSGKAKFNSKQAAEADLTYKADFGQLGAMLGLGGEDADEMHTLKYYADFEGERSYSCTDEGDWYWDELNLMVNPENLDREQLDEITLDKLFSDYSFDSDKNSYNFSGTLDLEALGESASSLTDAYGLSTDMLAPRAELQLDKDCHLRSLRIFIEPFTIELSEGVMEGLTVDLKQTDLQLEFSYDEVSVEIPAEVKETAVERPEGGNDDNDDDEVIDLEAIVLLDNDVLKVTADRIVIDVWFGDYTLYLTLENKSDKNLGVSNDATIINGYCVNSYLFEDLDAGDTLEVSLWIDNEDLDMIGIASPDEIRILLVVEDDEADWDEDPLVNEELLLYPGGKSAEEIEIPERRTEEDEKVLVENDDFLVVMLSAYAEESYGTVEAIADLYVENRSDKTLRFRWEDVKLNGEEFDPFYSVSLLSGLRAYTPAYFFDLEEKVGSEELNSIEFKLIIEDEDNWEDDPLFEESFTWEP